MLKYPTGYIHDEEKKFYKKMSTGPTVALLTRPTVSTSKGGTVTAGALAAPSITNNISSSGGVDNSSNVKANAGTTKRRK